MGDIGWVYMGDIGWVYMEALDGCTWGALDGCTWGAFDGYTWRGHWMGVQGGHWMCVHTHVGHSMGVCDGGHWMGVHGGHWMSEHRAWLYNNMWPTSWTMVPVKPQQALFPISQALAPLRPYCLNTICRNG